ncbi:MAG: hypothetical protein ACRDI2_14080, partial [Chloroflexota bacterium]
HLTKARMLLGPHPLDEARWQIAQALFEWHRNALEMAAEHGARALCVAEAAGGRAEASEACEMLAMSLLPLGRWQEALRYELRRDTAHWGSDVAAAVDAHLCLWEHHLRGEDAYARGQAFAEQMAHQAGRRGAVRVLAVGQYALGSMALVRGAFDTAGTHLARALALLEQVGSPAGMAYALARQIELLTAAGDAPAGWDLVGRGADAAQRAARGEHPLTLIHAAGIWNRVEAGDLAGAGALTEAAARLEAETRPCLICSAELFAAMAGCYAATGDVDAAVRYVDRSHQFSTLAHNRAGQARATRVRAQIHVARGDPAAAMAAYGEAGSLFDEVGHRYDAEKTLRLRQSLLA